MRRDAAPGRVAYAAYCEAMGGTYRDASALPDWSELKTYERKAWAAVAQTAVAHEFGKQQYLRR